MHGACGVLPEESTGSLFTPMPPGQSAPGLGWGSRAYPTLVAPRYPVLGGARAGGNVRYPRRARPRQEGDEPREAFEESSFRGVGERGRLRRGGSRWLAKAPAPLLSRSPGVSGMRGLKGGSPPRYAGKCPRTCPLSGPETGLA